MAGENPGRGALGLWLRAKKTIYTIFGRPFLHVDMVYDDAQGGIVVVADWNGAFIRKLDQLGYHDISEPDRKVDAYISNVWADTRSSLENDER
jgi:hypothetical protein